MRYLAVSKKKNPLLMWGWGRKIRPSRSQFVITRKASWCQSVILGTDFSILPSQSWWISCIRQLSGNICVLLTVAKITENGHLKRQIKTSENVICYLLHVLLSIGPVHFRFKGCWVDFFIFIQILIEQYVSKQWRLIRRRVVRRLVWVCTVCLRPTKRTLGLYLT